MPDDVRIATMFGRALMRKRSDEEAFALWSSLTTTVQTAVEPWLQLARAARRLRKHEACRDAARRVLELDPDHLEAAALVDSD